MCCSFAQASVAGNDGYAVIDGGWLDHNYKQLGKQVAWVAVGLSWTFVVTYAIMFVINLIPGCHFRASEEGEVVGMDVSDRLHKRIYSKRLWKLIEYDLCVLFDIHRRSSMTSI